MELAKKILPKLEVNQMLQSQDIIKTTADNKKIIFTSNNKEIPELVKDFSKQAMLKAGEAKGQIIEQEYKKAVETRIEGIKEDAAAYAYTHFDILTELNEQYNNVVDDNPELKSQIKRQITTKLLEIQKDLGVNANQIRVMTKTEAANFVYQYEQTAKGNAAKSQLFLQSITNNFGENASKALQELQEAGLPMTASLSMTIFLLLKQKKHLVLIAKKNKQF